MINDFFKKLELSPTQIKVFIWSFIMVFMMVTLQYLGVHSPLKFSKFISPIPQKKDIMDTIRPKLEKESNKFELKKQSQLIGTVYSASDADNASAYIVVDLDDGNILFNKNSSTKLPIASLTKIMSAVVALDLADPDEQFMVSQTASDEIPTKLLMQPGEKLSLEELLNAALLTSANDAVEVIQEGINKKYEADIFVTAMNEKAKILGLKSTKFANPQGFDSQNNYSSAEDLARLSQYALTKYPLISQIVKKSFEQLPESQTHQQYRLNNWNGLIDVYPDINGLKIGNTAKAGKTTIVQSSRGGKNILVVLLGAPGIVERDLWTAQLLDMAYEKTLGIAPVEVSREQLLAKYSTWQY